MGLLKKLKGIKITRGRFILGLGVLAALGIVGLYGIVSYTTIGPQYCLGCHATGETLDMSVKSLVHPESVGCYECHATPGKLVAMEYRHLFRADAERINPNCLRCHEDILTDARRNYKYNPLEIKIPHRFHVETVGARCTDCHANIAHDWEQPQTNRPTMESCYQCHTITKTACGMCHPKGTAVRPKQKEIYRSECRRCHGGFEVKPLKVYGIEFPHLRHLERPITCSTCHSNAQKHGEILKSRAECLSCHHRQVEAPCQTCHERQRGFKRGQALGEEKAQPGLMAELQCIACHQKIQEGHRLSDVKATCVGCHGEGYDMLIAGLQGEIALALRATGNQLAYLRALVKPEAPGPASEAMAFAGEAERYLKVIERDGSRGFHNQAYALKLIERAKEKLERAERLLGVRPASLEKQARVRVR